MSHTIHSNRTKNKKSVTKLTELLSEIQLANDLPVEATLGGGPRQVYQAGLSYVDLDPAPCPTLLSFSTEVASWFKLTKDHIDQFIPVLSGSESLPDITPYATCYGGHQFGAWAGQLGDGRATSLGIFKGLKWEDLSKNPDTFPYKSKQQFIDTHGLGNPDEPQWEWQLKGAGITPYSRRGDGKAVLRSSVREYLCSEAMAALGVPTTRALSLVDTGEKVWRDMFYNGNAKQERGAIVCRVAPSFVRFGHFELPSSRGDYTLTRLWVDHVIKRHFFPLWGETTQQEVNEEHILRWFTELSQRTSFLISEWMRVGFVHGVMNTDNMSALGLTIDYGPYGWIDDFDLVWTPNTTDFGQRRYCFGRQADMAHWNLSRLAFALAPLVKDIEPFIELLEEWPDLFRKEFARMFCRKLGTLSGTEPGLNQSEQERELINLGMKVWPKAELDMTLFFRALGQLELHKTPTEWQSQLRHTLYEDDGRLSTAERQKGREELWDWLNKYYLYLGSIKARQSPERREEVMNKTNPIYVLRNYLAQEAIDGLEQGDRQPLETLKKILMNPYVEQTDANHVAKLRPQWARTKPGCSTLSCSS